MLESIAVILIGLIPGMLSSYLITRGVGRYLRRHQDAQVLWENAIARQPAALPPADYRYVEGLGYIVGDLSCQFNARSPHLRCAVNPSGPCQECSAYQAIVFPEEQEDLRSLRFRRV
jgi:hypothetical protein